MDSIISIFHIDWKLLIAQIFNFGIVLATLYYFAFKPLVKTMSDRSERIDQSLKNADEIEARLHETEIEKIEIISTARKQALVLLEEAERQGTAKRAELIESAREDISQVINSEKEKLRLEKAEILKDIKSQVADLVVLIVEKFLTEKIDTKHDRELIEKIVKQ